MTLTLALMFAHPIAVAETDEQAYQEGLALQQARRTEDAIKAYGRAIALNPDNGRAHYELGWSYWVLGDWSRVVHHWRLAKRLRAAPDSLDRYLAEAERNLAGETAPLVRAAIGTQAGAVLPSGDRISLRLAARFQHYNDHPADPQDHYDPYVFSPKSVRFLHDGSKAYVNALEGYATVIYDPATLTRVGLIAHRFRQKDAALFQDLGQKQWTPFPAGAPENPDSFNGKPVESALSVDGRWLWIPYYRRDYDTLSVMPSAIAIVDSRSDRIVRVMATGPIPKYVASSPDGKWLAVIHWGDNTVGLINTSGSDPSSFTHAGLVTVGKRIDLNKIEKADRDHGCGFCLRGAVFTPDSKYLLVARMGGGGIAIIDVQAQRYVGTVYGMRPTPRHLVLTSDGNTLYLSSSFAGYVSAYRVQDLVDAARRGQRMLKPLREVFTGAATRTIAISPDDRFIYAAVNKESEIVVLEAETLKRLFSLPADSYPVGMAVSPDSRQLWVTSQGREGRGGNSVMVYEITVSGRVSISRP